MTLGFRIGLITTLSLFLGLILLKKIADCYYEKKDQMSLNELDDQIDIKDQSVNDALASSSVSLTNDLGNERLEGPLRT